MCIIPAVPMLLDDELLGLLNRSNAPWARTLLAPYTNSAVLVALGIASALYVGLRSRSKWVGAMALVVAVVVSDVVAAYALQPFFERRPPCAAADSRAVAPEGCPPGHSLPSRQAAAAAAGALVFSASVPVLSGIAAALALFIGASRVWLGQAWPTDVIAGLMLGSAVGALLLSASRLRFLRWE